MQVGSLVRSNVDGSVGIVTEVKPPTAKDWRPKFRVLFPNDGEIWLTSQVLEVICK